MSTRLAEQWGVPTIATRRLVPRIGRRSRTCCCVGGFDVSPVAMKQVRAGCRSEEARWRRWLTRAVDEMLAPIATLVWIHGVSLRSRSRHSRRDAGHDDGNRSGRPWLVLRCERSGALFWLLWRVGGIIELFLLSLSARADTSWDDLLLPLAGKTARRALPLLALILGAPALSVSPALAEVVRNATSLLLIGVVAFILFQVVDVAAAFVLKQHRLDVTDNLQARAIHTQVMVLKKVALTVIGVFTLASMLMVFESVRQFGASILASAGRRQHCCRAGGPTQHCDVAGRVPNCIDSADSRRRRGHCRERVGPDRGHHADVRCRANLGPATPDCADDAFHRATIPELDAIVVRHPVHRHVASRLLRAGRDAARELTRILQQSRYWDGRVNVLQVTDTREHTVEVRALASAADASLAWDLRCEVREQLIGFVQRDYPDSLPRLRATFAADPTERGSASLGGDRRGP